MYQYFQKLLDETGVTAAEVCNATGIKSGTISNWKRRDSQLNMTYLKKIADYFGVRVEYFIDGKLSDEPDLNEPMLKLVATNMKNAVEAYKDSETAKMAQEIKDSKELSLLFNAARDAKPEDLKITYEMLLALKRKEQPQ